MTSQQTQAEANKALIRRYRQKLSKNSKQIERRKHPTQQYVNMGNLDHAFA
jgi:hypothetical protein